MATRKTTRTVRKAAKKATARKAPARKAATKKAASKTAKAPKKAVKKAVKKATKKVVRKSATRSAASKTARKATSKTTKAPARKAASSKKAATKSAKTAAKKATKKVAKVVKVAKKAAPRTTAKKAVPRSGGTTTRKTAGSKAVSSNMAQLPRAAPTGVASTRAAKPRSGGRGTPARARKPHHITPEEALANTRELLEAKQARDREPPPWRQFDPDHGHPAHEHATPTRDAEQEAQAAAHAEELHRGESRMNAIQGSISGQDRHQQGRRDAKG